MLNVLGAGAAVVATTQKILCPVDTGATRASITSHYNKGENEVLVGPSTDYSIYIEYGTTNPNYPIQPFVVPSGTGSSRRSAISAIGRAVFLTLVGKGVVNP